MIRKIDLKNRFCTLFDSWKLIYQADRKKTLLLALLIPLQGLTPILSAVLVSRIVGALSEQRGSIVPLLVGWGGCTLADYLLAPIVLFLQGELTDNLSDRIHCNVFEKVIQIEDLKTAESAEFQDELQMLQNEVSFRPVNLIIFTGRTLSSCITVLGVLSSLAYYNVLIALLLIFALIPQSIVLYRLQGEAFDNLVQRSPLSREMNNYSDILLEREYAKELRLFRYGHYIQELYRSVFYKIYKNNCHMRCRKLGTSVCFFAFGAAFCTLAFAYAVSGASAGRFDIGDVSLFASCIVLASGTLISMADDCAMLYDTVLFMEKYFSFMNRVPDMTSGQRKIGKEGITSVEFKDVSFTYPGSSTKALEHISFSISEGSRIGIVGMNGSGKSTVFKLLCRLYDVDEGTILINGFPIAEYDIESLRLQFCVAFQDFSQYRLSVEQNIFLSDVLKPHRDTEVDSAIVRVQANGFISSLPNGKKQKLGRWLRDSVDLSGGEWQKIALARAMFRRGSVMLFDEPSAALDAQSAELYWKAMEEESQGKISFFITHYLSGISFADQILVLEHGHLIESGTHTQLLEKNGAYAKLFHTQSERFMKEKCP